MTLGAPEHEAPALRARRAGLQVPLRADRAQPLQRQEEAAEQQPGPEAAEQPQEALQQALERPMRRAQVPERAQRAQELLRRAAAEQAGLLLRELVQELVRGPEPEPLPQPEPPSPSETSEPRRR